MLTGATFVAAAGGRLYITSPQGLAVVSVEKPTQPELKGHYGGSFLKNPKAVAIQFQYAFVTDDEGLKVFNIVDPDHPVPVPGAVVPLAEANRLYAARTYVYVANGKEGLAIIDVEHPEHPHLYQMYNAEGRLNDTRAVQIGSISASMFALVADGRNGMRVIQLISPENVPENAGFSPRPNPVLIATAPLKSGEAIAVGRGLDRDRVVDETGAQTVVFGRRGSRPFNLVEMSPFLRHLGNADASDSKSPHTGAFLPRERCDYEQGRQRGAIPAHHLRGVAGGPVRVQGPQRPGRRARLRAAGRCAARPAAAQRLHGADRRAAPAAQHGSQPAAGCHPRARPPAGAF